MLRDFKTELQQVLAKVPVEFKSSNDMLFHRCEDLQERFPEFYTEFKSSIIVAKAMLQLVKREIFNWDVLF